MGKARIENRKGSINRQSGASLVFFGPGAGHSAGSKKHFLIMHLRAATFAGVFPLFSHHILAA